MGKGTRILFIIFFAIILFILGEIFYLFFYLPSLQKDANPTSKNTQNQSVGINTQNTAIKDDNQAISYDATGFLFVLQRFRKGVLTKSIISNTYEGTITELKIDEKAVALEPKLTMRLEGSEGLSNNLSFSLYEVDTLGTWRQQENGEQVDWSYMQLRKGDKIQIVSVLNLVENVPKNRISLTFTKIE